MMHRSRFLAVALVLGLAAGCTNYLYQGEITAEDTMGKQRHFILYWTKTEPFIGQAKAGPAVLLTECSPARIELGDQSGGIVFRGEQGRDRVKGQTNSVGADQICGRVTNYHSLEEAKAGPMLVVIECEPMPPDEFAVKPRTYLAPRPEAYSFPIVEKVKKWSLMGETLPGPPAPECSEQ